MKLKQWLASFIFLLFVILNGFQSVFMASRTKQKIYDFPNWKHLRGGLPWIFTEPKVGTGGFPWSLGMETKKIVIHGNWNPRAWNTDLTWDWLYWHSAMYYINWYFENSNICVSLKWTAAKKNVEIFLKFGKINPCSLEYLLEV